MDHGIDALFLASVLEQRNNHAKHKGEDINCFRLYMAYYLLDNSWCFFTHFSCQRGLDVFVRKLDFFDYSIFD